MPASRPPRGLSLGQLITLTFGFLGASVIIFALGYWVGFDLAQQQVEREQQVVRLPAPTPPPTPTPSAAAQPGRTEPAARATGVAAGPSPQIPTAGAPTQVPTATRPPTQTARATATRTIRPTATRAPTRVTTPLAASGWTVQALSTTEVVQAAMLARSLRAKGYEAFTVTEERGGRTRYSVRVGRFSDRTQAKIMEIRLREIEGLSNATVVTQ